MLISRNLISYAFAGTAGLLLSACTIITNNRIVDAVDCADEVDGVVCGDGLVCRNNVCVEDTRDGGCEGGACSTLDTMLTSMPSATSGPDVTFQFTATDLGATFECSLDGAAFTTCTSPQSYSALASGSHNFRVRARLPTSLDDSPILFTWTVDANQLDTTITMGPGTTTNGSATFQFTGNNATGFECKLGPSETSFTACTSGKTYTSLAEMGGAPYTFEVRATGMGGAVDDTPASQQFTVDTTGPDVQISGTPAALATVNSTVANLTFAPVVAEPMVTYLCRFNMTAAFSACTSFMRTGLGDGVQTLRVKGVDRFGNEGPEVVHTWTIAPLATTIFAIRTTPIAAGTRVQIGNSGGMGAPRMTIMASDRFWAQETNGTTTPDNRGITVVPRTFNQLDPLNGMGVQLNVIGTVNQNNTNLELIDATFTRNSAPGVMPVDPRSTGNDVNMLHREENEGLWVGTGGTYRATVGMCNFGTSHIETCDNANVAHVCPIFQPGVIPANNEDYSIQGILEGTALGYRLRVSELDVQSDVCL